MWQGRKEASSLDQIKLTKNQLEFDRKISHGRLLILELDRNFSTTNSVSMTEIWMNFTKN